MEFYNLFLLHIVKIGSNLRENMKNFTLFSPTLTLGCRNIVRKKNENRIMRGGKRKKENKNNYMVKYFSVNYNKFPLNGKKFKGRSREIEMTIHAISNLYVCIYINYLIGKMKFGGVL